MDQEFNLDGIDAETLYRLAREKAAEEERARIEANKEQIKEKKAERKAMISRHAKELAALDAELEQLSGGEKKVKANREPRPLETDTISGTLVEIIGQRGEISLGEIREAAEEMSLPVKNLAQTLAYLKRTGRLESTQRGYYKTP